MGDFVGSPYRYTKFGANPSMGFLGEQVKCNNNFVYLFMPPFLELTRSDQLAVFHV